ncbi:unnamed protein product [Protopolystoma xenopodis]|uniref:Uncharacterized protein n=1 Tax=Protopolystoma xenopodis TaxID=117903 RepID=A0A3S4ZXN8_9PLAT|nr:unnamed protein product [Protopolystoma xenopodis]
MTVGLAELSRSSSDPTFTPADSLRINASTATSLPMTAMDWKDAEGAAEDVQKDERVALLVKSDTIATNYNNATSLTASAKTRVPISMRTKHRCTICCRKKRASSRSLKNQLGLAEITSHNKPIVRQAGFVWFNRRFMIPCFARVLKPREIEEGKAQITQWQRSWLMSVRKQQGCWPSNSIIFPSLSPCSSSSSITSEHLSSSPYRSSSLSPEPSATPGHVTSTRHCEVSLFQLDEHAISWLNDPIIQGSRCQILGPVILKLEFIYNISSFIYVEVM